MPNFNLTRPIPTLFLMLLCLLISCFTFTLFFKSLPLNSLPSWANDMRLLFLSPWSWKGLLLFPSLGFLIRKTLHKSCYFISIFPRKMSTKRMALVSNQNLEVSNETQVMSILDLPELALECILERLPPSALLNMVCVCTSLKERCASDHLWERHMKLKWGGIIGPAAYREWKWQIASRKEMGSFKQEKQKGLVRLLSMFWLPSWLTRPKVDVDHQESLKQRSLLPVDSIMSWYLALETGRFWFPAQVFNRENGHVGFILSCYDAELSYDPLTDTFQARYPPHGRRAVAIEHNVPWERLRAPPIDTSPHHLHISDCLNDLRPGDHFEIQWRKNKEFPYGWWYGVVGHLESCDGNEFYCRCHNSDTVILEFHQYTPGSRWRRTAINRKDHREEGNEADGFYGGIRKLYNNEEISRWKQLWPADVLE